MTDYVQPTVQAKAFHCPHCGSYSDQFWTKLSVYNGRASVRYDSYDIGYCRRCEEITIWKDYNMIFPLTGNAPLPNTDMPDDIKNDYIEARDIAGRSPRSACVLLRLCIEKICNEQKVGSGDLNEKIGNLVKRGLDERIQKALDSIRVIGGQAVHPLEMDLRDDPETANSLFGLVNLISDWAYTQTKKIGNIYDKLPEKKKKAIQKRDDAKTN